ncbi:4-hydroxybenzoyl-CoA thioesterase [Rhodopirellula maiorica SM1]|uniref:4-hydroxybenzoyl-CoA thioesterase n=1 Tax=Rhodopirellula maiorica SM1 TaxID=1265738 RepID=M5R8D0_9BACT|nr:thioesterase family protein [Rhodopirellula maiorica]EMI15738.1 4-hydroxybenzoyl-CoA thioesterase [Rhodopirellula maiorica SM1]
MFTLQRRVEFRDTDAAGIVHFSAFFPMMEAAEHAMLRSLGISVMPPHVGGGHSLSESAAGSQADATSRLHVTWPRVSAHCDYRAAARFEDILDITVSVLRLGNSSVEYGIRFSRAELADASAQAGGSADASAQAGGSDASAGSHPTWIAEGKLTAVCCTLSPGGKLKKTPIPEDLRKLLAKHLDSQTFSADHA